MKADQSEVFPSVDDLARELGVSRQKVYEGLRKNQIPHIKLGKRFILPRAAISQWLRTAGGKVAA